MRSSRFQLNRARWDAAAQAAAVIARAMGYRAGPPPLPDEADENARESNWSHGETTRASPTGPRKPVRPTVRRKRPDSRTRKVVRENPPGAWALTGWATTPPRYLPARPLSVRHQNIWDILACFLTEALAHPG